MARFSEKVINRLLKGTDVMKLTLAFHDFAIAPKTDSCCYNTKIQNYDFHLKAFNSIYSIKQTMLSSNMATYVNFTTCATCINMPYFFTQCTLFYPKIHTHGSCSVSHV